MKPIEQHSVVIKHKIINEQPFLELTILDGDNIVDTNTLRPTENMTMMKLIYIWMYHE